MYGSRSWWASGLLLLSACGGRTALEFSTDDERAAPFGGAPGIGSVANATGGAETGSGGVATGIGGGAPAHPAVVTAVSAGAFHTCGVTAAGIVKCWGAGTLRSDSSSSASLVPVDVTGLSSGVLAVSTGGDYSACVLTATGAVKCWGGGSFHQDGVGNIPADVEGLSSGIVGVSVGGQATCALRSSGTVSCWGYDIGNGNGARFIPVDVKDLSGVQSVSAGARHFCVVTSGGAVQCWGRSDVGQLGNRSSAETFELVDVVGLSSGVISVSAGYHQTCAVTSAGALKCWGANDYGQVGNNTTLDSLVPADVVGLSAGVVAVSAGEFYTCAVTSAGAVKCWGSLRWGQFGDPKTTDTSLVPVDIAGLSSGVVSVSVGDSHACAATSTGAVKCWGANDYGQLGNGTTIGSSVPVDVLGF